MVEEVLSQSEVEALLSEMENVPAPAPAEPSTPQRAPAQPAPAQRPREKVIPYDFKRPERVGQEQMRALQSLHEGFGRSFSASLSAMIRTIVEVKLTSIDQLTYSEFVFSLENPTCFNLIRADPLEGSFILDLSPAIVYPLIDRLLGGGKESSSPARRPLTEIELRLVSRITKVFLEELKIAWENVQAVEFSVDRVESNPQLVQAVPPNEVVILVTFEITIGEARGMMNLCIPFNSIERVSSKLTSNTWVSYGKSGSSPEDIAKISNQLDGSLVELVVTLAETKITTADLIGLRVGDIIATDHDIRTPLSVAVEGIAKFRASAGALKGRKAIEVNELVEVPAV